MRRWLDTRRVKYLNHISPHTFLLNLMLKSETNLQSAFQRKSCVLADSGNRDKHFSSSAFQHFSLLADKLTG